MARWRRNGRAPPILINVSASMLVATAACGSMPRLIMAGTVISDPLPVTTLSTLVRKKTTIRIQKSRLDTSGFAQANGVHLAQTSYLRPFRYGLSLLRFFRGRHQVINGERMSWLKFAACESSENNLFADSQPLAHLLVQKPFSSDVRLHPFAIDDELWDRAFAGALYNFIHRTRRGFNIDLFVWNVVLRQKTLGLAAIRTPCR